MSLHALTATGSGNTALIVLALTALLVYLGSVWRNPFAPCRWCNGKPKTTGVLFTRAFDLCKHCNGSGRRVRPAARLFPRNYDVK